MDGVAKGLSQMFVVVLVLMVVSMVATTIIVASTKAEVKKLGNGGVAANGTNGNEAV